MQRDELLPDAHRMEETVMRGSSESKNRVGRRVFAKMLAGGGAASAALLAQEPAIREPAGQKPPPPPQNQPAQPPNPNTAQQRRGTMPEIPPFGETLSFTRADVAPRVQPFSMTEVRITGGPYQAAQEWNRGYM